MTLVTHRIQVPQVAQDCMVDDPPVLAREEVKLEHPGSQGLHAASQSIAPKDITSTQPPGKSQDAEQQSVWCSRQPGFGDSNSWVVDWKS